MAADPSVAPAAFVNTNVLVYASQKSSRFHTGAAGRLERARRDGEALWISRQVLREYLAAMTRPQPGQAAAPLTAAQAVADVERFERDFNVAEDGPESACCVAIPSPASRCTTRTWSRPCWLTGSRDCSPSTPRTSGVSALRSR